VSNSLNVTITMMAVSCTYLQGLFLKPMLGDYPMVALFYWDMNGSQQLEQLFSVASSSQKRSVKARAIVTHISDEESGGEWLCSKDRKTATLCTHVRLAAAYLLGLWGQSDKVDDAAGIITPDVCKWIDALSGI